MYFPIKFYGQNTGNQNDTIYVNATLFTDVGDYVWNSNFQVDRYSLPDQYFSNEFNFTYDQSDIFPSPGIYRLKIQAMSQRSTDIIKSHDLFLNFTNFYDVDTSIAPNESMIFANWEMQFSLSLTNTGNIWDNFTLISEGWDDYLSYPTNILNVGPMKSREVTISLQIPDPSLVGADNYTFRMIATSDRSGEASIFSVCDANVTILAPDYVPPGIVFLVPSDPTVNLTFPQSPLILGPVWQAYDNWPDLFEVFRDGIPYMSGSWSNITPIQVPVTGPVDPLPEGDHNITITFSDTNDNRATAQVWVSIKPLDVDKPSVVPIVDSLTLPENFTYPQFITWNWSEEFLLNTTIYLNDTELPQTDYIIGQEGSEASPWWYTKYMIKPNSLSMGIWNYTILIRDMGNNINTSTILVNITSPDSTAPSLVESPYTSGYLARGENVSFVAEDAFPSRYEFWINSALVRDETWQSNAKIVFMLDDIDLKVGTNTLEIRIYDIADNMYVHQWPFNLIDVDPPDLLIAPLDLVIFEHNASQVDAPYWQLYDPDPNLGQYSIYRNNILIEEGTWLPGNGTIQVPISNLIAGIHNFDIQIRDATGNMRIDSVVVTVRDVIEPYIWPLEAIYFEPVYSMDWFEFLIDEIHPDAYQIYKNHSVIEEGSLSESSLFVLVKLDDYSSGTFNYTLVVEDESGNRGSRTVLVYVTNFIPPLIRKPADLLYPEDTTGHWIIWEILEALPHNYSIYQNDELLRSGELTSNQLSISVDGLDLGTYKYVVVVYDQYGMSHSCTSYVTVVDIITPTLTHVADVRFLEKDPDAKIVWIAEDAHPAFYTITQNGSTVIPTTAWINNEITLLVVGWTTGTYNVQIQVTDTSGNSAFDEVIVKIVSEESVTKPIKISAPGFEYFIVVLTFAILSFSGVLRRKKQRNKEL